MAKANLAVVARSAVASESPEVAERGRPRVAGKFFFHNGEKVFVRGVTYGPFTAGTHGARFPERDQVDHDFAAMRELGANCVRTFTPPPRWMLDLAAESRPRGASSASTWTEHVCFLDVRGDDGVEPPVHARRGASIARPPVRSSRILLGNEIPPDVVRWRGPDRVREFLRSLADDVRGLDPRRSGQLRELPVDRVPRPRLHRFRLLQRLPAPRGAFRRYLARLQNLAEDKPLVLTEFGIDSIREGADEQATILSWQMRAAFEGGVAGTSIFSWTDEWFTGGVTSTTGPSDWSTATAHRSRRSTRCSDIYRGAAAAAARARRRLSVVICAYNAESHDGGVPRVAAAAALPEFRGDRRQRRLDRRDPGDRRALRASPVFAPHPPGEQGSVDRPQRRHRGRDGRVSSRSPIPTAWSIPTG